MVLVALAMVAIIAMAALSIDVVTLYLARMEAQRSADAAALAAAQVISISGITGDPTNSSGSWGAICGGATSPATQAAIAAAKQNMIGANTPVVNVTYFAVGASPSPDCSGLPAAFGVNPLVTAQVTRSGLPTFFSRVWGRSGNTVSATATAEAFNASNSANVGNGPTGTITPVQPRCVKPWIIPNLDPLPSKTCTTDCGPFVNTSSGQIARQGISLNGTGANAVIGETFWLTPDCRIYGSACTLRTSPNNPPQANYYPSWPPYIRQYLEPRPNLQYLPGQAPSATPVAVPSCSSSGSMYQQAIAGCDQSTVYQCGVPNMNTVDLSVNPDDITTDGVACLIDEDDPTTPPPAQPTGQDTIDISSYPFKMLTGTSNPLVGNGLATGTPITSSPSVVSLPIYDSGPTSNPTAIATSGKTPVTIVGFLQVFIDQVDQYGNVRVIVLNVTGCSNGTGQPVGAAVTGTSPVPVRLITPP
jgi:hypothetical protein